MRKAEYTATWFPPDLSETVKKRQKKSLLKPFNHERSKSHTLRFTNINATVYSLSWTTVLHVTLVSWLYLYSHDEFSSQWSHLDTTILTFSGLCNYEYLKKNQLDAQLILSIFRQNLHVSAVSSPIIRRYNRMFTTVGTYCSF